MIIDPLFTLLLSVTFSISYHAYLHPTTSFMHYYPSVLTYLVYTRPNMIANS